MAEFDDNDPRVIAAKADAETKKAEARAKLSPAAQTVYAVFDSLDQLLKGLGCLIIIVIIVISFFAPQLWSYLFGS